MDTYKVKFQFRNERGNWSIPTTATFEAQNSFQAQDRIKAQYGGSSNVRILSCIREGSTKYVSLNKGTASKTNDGDKAAVFIFFVIIGIIVAILPVLTVISFVAPSLNIPIIQEHPIITAICMTLLLLFIVYKILGIKGIIIYSVLSILFAIAVFFFPDSSEILSLINNKVSIFFQ